MHPLFSRRLSLVGILAAIWLSCSDGRATTTRWTLDSFRAYAEGTLADGGVNTYVAADGTIRLINAFDLNQDGRPDIFLPCTHGYNEKTDLSIYPWNNGYDPKRVLHLPTEGGKAATIADLNRDGYPDLVVVNSFDGTNTALHAYIYWGGPNGFSASRRTDIPTESAVAVAAADLNRDGWPELIIAADGLTYHEAVDEVQSSYIYWNESGHFSAVRRTTLHTVGASDVAVADLNGDGKPDLVFAQAGNAPGEAGARIFWGGDKPYDLSRSAFLPGEGCTAVKAADLNGDGLPDLVLANGKRLKGREAGIYDLVDTVHLDSYIYWNSSRGFDPARRTGLPTIGASAIAIADLDHDGAPDVIFANSAGGESFVYWGSRDGFLARRRLALPTEAASAVLTADLNGDGASDVVFANFRSGATFDIDSVVYWGSATGPSADRRQRLPTAGATAVVAAPNPNGHLDLVFINKMEGTDDRTPSALYLSDTSNSQVFSPQRRIAVDTQGPNQYAAADLNGDGIPDLVVPGSDALSIYWGSRDGYQRDHRTIVPCAPTFGLRVADFNRDGYLDLMLSEWHPGSTETHVYYGGPAGFSKEASTALPMQDNRCVLVADFNRDGWLDAAFTDLSAEKVVIFWNGPDGFKPDRRTELPAHSAVSLQVADLNHDGWLDLIVPNLFDLHPNPENRDRAFGGSPNGGVFIYWGSPAGFAAQRRTFLPALGAEYVAAADLRHTHRLDLVVTSYHAGTRRDEPSYVYWNTAQGFAPDAVMRLPTNSASGAMVMDFNDDGWPDLLFANHQANGDHRNPSYLYWGGPDGFSAQRRLELPATGPHFLSCVDPGNIYDREPVYTYDSPAKEFPGAQALSALTWNASTPPGTAVSFQIRSAATPEGLRSAAWEGPTGASSEFSSPAPSGHWPLGGSWIQFRALLASKGGGLPVLRTTTLEVTTSR